MARQARQAKQLQERPDSSENHTKDEKMLPSVRVTSVDVRVETLRVMSRRGRRVKCTARRGAEQGTTLREYTGELREYVNEKSTERS